MSLIRVLEQADRKIDDLIDDVIHGSNEDPWDRYSRRIEFSRRYPNHTLTLLAPGAYAYYSIKDTINDSNLSRKKKAEFILLHLSCELALDVTRFGVVYGNFLLIKYLYS